MANRYKALRDYIATFDGDPVATAENTLAEIRKNKVTAKSVSKEDAARMTDSELDELKKKNLELSSYLQEIEKRLVPERVPIKGASKASITPTGANQREYVTAQTTLDSLLATKQYIGDAYGNPSHPNHAEAKRLYGFISDDYEAAFEKAGIGQEGLELKKKLIKHLKTTWLTQKGEKQFKELRSTSLLPKR